MAMPPSPPPESVAPSAESPLDDWLAWIGGVHPEAIELGLDRVRRVAERLDIARPPLAVVIVGGTNGKGSTVRMLESVWTAAGHRVGASTSPHITRFNERVRVAGAEASDADLVRAFARVEAARTAPDGVDSLTYFEFATLATMLHFIESGCVAAIMEVGLGGRLDAVNLWDADCAVLTSIALDHADWLGDDVGVIATEKAAIGRRGRPFVLGEPSPPETLAPYVREAGFELVDVGARPPSDLPETGLAGLHQRRNAACALAVAERLDARLPTDPDLARAALLGTSLAARFERRVAGGTVVVLDVAHNPAAAVVLASTWRERFGETRAVAVFAAFADKDIESITAALAGIVSHWCCAALDGPRAASREELGERVRAGLDVAAAEGRTALDATRETARDRTAAEVDVALDTFGSVDAALAKARELAESRGAPVLACGSFLTVAAVHAALDG